MGNHIFLYHDRRLDAELLKLVSKQGILVNVDSKQLTTVARFDHSELVVVATGKDSYDVLLGSYREGIQKARLISKVVLKKAEWQDPALIRQQQEQQWSAPVGGYDRYNRDRSYQRRSNY